MENDNNAQYYEPAPVEFNNDIPADVQEGKGVAIASLVTGILGVLCCSPCAIAAIICSIVAKSKGNTSGMAKAGLILGIIGIVVFIINIILAATGALNFNYSFNM